MARLDRIAEAKEVAQIAACIGREFSHGLLTEVVERPAAELDDALNKLVAAELIFRRGPPPTASYSFKHALVQDAAYQSLLKSKRQQLHAKILDALTGLGDSSAETLARHAAIAGRHAEALSHFENAGRVAHFRGAQREAAAHYKAALTALEQLGDRFAGSSAARAKLLLARGTAVGGVEGWRSEAMLAHLRDAIAAAEASGEHEVLFDALCWLWSVDNAGGDHRSSLANAKRLVATVAGFEEPSFEAAARATLGCSSLCAVELPMPSSGSTAPSASVRTRRHQARPGLGTMASSPFPWAQSRSGTSATPSGRGPGRRRGSRMLKPAVARSTSLSLKRSWRSSMSAPVTCCVLRRTPGSLSAAHADKVWLIWNAIPRSS